jgi:hypothetical protein
MRQLSLFKGKRQRGTKPKPVLEFRTHVMVADALKLGSAPGWVWSHFPAGEKRDPKTAGRLKRMGVMPGWPDFLLISPEGRLHCLELKRGPAPLTQYQTGFGDAMLARGVPYEVARSFSEAMDVLTDWKAVRLMVTA